MHETSCTPPDSRRDLYAQDGRRLGAFHALSTLQARSTRDLRRLPCTLRIVLEALLRHHDGSHDMTRAMSAVLDWQPRDDQRPDVPFTVARILAPDASGIPLLADLAAMRDAAREHGAPATAIAPALPVDLVVDHSLQVDHAGAADAAERNLRLEFTRNAERYGFLKWAAQAFERIRIVPPGNGILHQVNLEFLAHQVCQDGDLLYPDSLIGPDSHTAMINGLGVLGWGVGGIEAEAAMLGQPLMLRLPDVVGVELSGRVGAGITTTDIALTLTRHLRQAGVVGKFVEFVGAGAAELAAPERCTIANMAPEYGATAAFFCIDERTMDYLASTGRSPEHLERIRAYWRAQDMFGIPAAGDIDYSALLHIDLSTIRPSVSGPSRPQDRIDLRDMAAQFERLLSLPAEQGGFGHATRSFLRRPVREPQQRNAGLAAPAELADGDIVIAAITSCANTSNPAVLLAAGLLARHAVRRGLRAAPHVKTSFTPGSKAVAAYLQQAGLLESLASLGFQVAGFGCATCMGNSGPLPEAVQTQIAKRNLVVAAVLSGNRNFEARVHPAVRANYLMSPPLVVAFAIAGRILDTEKEPLGFDCTGVPVFLQDLWPAEADIQALLPCAADSTHFRIGYAAQALTNPLWDALPAPHGEHYTWNEASTYLRRPPFLQAVPASPAPLEAIAGARALAILGDSITTDHISPGGAIAPDSPAGIYLQANGVAPISFNTYVARRANHEVMIRGTFANVRLRNRMAGGREGGWTRLVPDGNIVSISEAAATYRERGVPLLVFAGREYGTGSSRDWAAKGTYLLGVRAVIASSFERIHRSNLVGMGVLPCQLPEGIDSDTLDLDGSETFAVEGLGQDVVPGQILDLRIWRSDGRTSTVALRLCVETSREAAYIRQGGVLPHVLRHQLAWHDAGQSGQRCGAARQAR
ncbi:aconitate hydratase AcnA [Verticiella sediminum]|uniref:Aconitate hydratase n=1 Tax=Verticiella sediminum TaxID=1247510 RepID=A0A556AVK6_9BURK|nr:aconitate hydratase AcnA [Verticiella sediminum]TSH96415.1 aconitate hydratase AcnA [Verticiella sediminum]